MIGDVLTSSVLFEVLKNHFPKDELHYLINSHTQAVVQGNRNIDKLVLFTSEMEQNKLRFFSFLKEIKKAKYDVVIDVYGKMSSKLISKASGAKMRIAYEKQASSLFYTHQIKRLKTPKYHASLAIENRLRLLEPLGISFEPVAPRITLTKMETDQAKAVLIGAGISSEEKLYMISVLGSDPSKTYPFEYMAQLLDEMIKLQPKAQVLFNYIPKQEKEAKAIYDATSEVTQKQIYFEVFGNSLREFLALTKHCDAMFGNEGGAVNMAKALDIPTFIIFSPHLNKGNWFGETENTKHMAVHLDEFIQHTKEDRLFAKKDPRSYYLKFKPTFIAPLLTDFLRAL